MITAVILTEYSDSLFVFFFFNSGISNLALNFILELLRCYLEWWEIIDIRIIWIFTRVSEANRLTVLNALGRVAAIASSKHAVEPSELVNLRTFN